MWQRRSFRYLVGGAKQVRKQIGLAGTGKLRWDLSAGNEDFILEWRAYCN